MDYMNVSVITDSDFRFPPRGVVFDRIEHVLEIKNRLVRAPSVFQLSKRESTDIRIHLGDKKPTRQKNAAESNLGKVARRAMITKK
jgi:hypothetical protein